MSTVQANNMFVVFTGCSQDRVYLYITGVCGHTDMRCCFMSATLPHTMSATLPHTMSALLALLQENERLYSELSRAQQEMKEGHKRMVEERGRHASELAKSR